MCMKARRLKHESGTFEEKLARLSPAERDKLTENLRGAWRSFSASGGWKVAKRIHAQITALRAVSGNLTEELAYVKGAQGALQSLSDRVDWKAMIAFHRRIKSGAGDQRKAPAIERLKKVSITEAQDIGRLFLPRVKGAVPRSKIPDGVFAEIDRLTTEGVPPTPAARRALLGSGLPADKNRADYAVKKWAKRKRGI